MIIYLEKSQADNPQALCILAKFPHGSIIEIENYKNIFDTPQVGETQKSIIIAGVKNPITQAPVFYGYSGKGFFLKNSLNCIYDCQYCYLQGIFKNENNVFFVNYEYIKKQITDTLKNINSKNPIWFYSSDYSDNLATDNLTGFTQEFVPFFGTLSGAKMEIRTKSINIQGLLEMTPNNNVEIAFSLSPDEIIQEYEAQTPGLDQRIDAINKLLQSGWQVGIRFMPLIGCSEYQKIYSNFLDTVLSGIDMEKLYSVFVGGLLFTEHDYKILQKKQTKMKLLYEMKLESDGFYRQDREVRDWFYREFSNRIQSKKVSVCFDSF